MTKERLKKSIIKFECIGFLIVILFLWANEIFDIPHNVIGSIATPINWVETIIESVVVLVLCITISIFSLILLKRIKYLEGFLYVCSFCKKIRVGKDWIPIEEYIRDHSEAEFSHSLCPKCAEKYYGKYLSEDNK